ncbi:MAG TPA: AbrB/MazE/SpoVT family DNA-binding domain-containing protein [Actinopolymorphaceae bacterium]
MGADDGKYASTVRVGEKGQIVIPKAARELFGITPGDTLLLLADVRRGIAIVRPDLFEQFPDGPDGPDASDDATDEHRAREDT